MKTSHSQTLKGFTLIELLVVIAIIGILVAISIPAYNSVLRKVRMTQCMNNGKNIFTALLAERSDRGGVFPGSPDGPLVETSTDYWKWAVTNEYIDSTFIIFAAYGLPGYEGLNPDEFSEVNNAWCIVSGIREIDRSMMPVMFTRNLTISELGQPTAGDVADTEPFGTFGVVVINKDSSARVRDPRELSTSFNPAGATNAVLRP